jgi:hypothetical protein
MRRGYAPVKRGAGLVVAAAILVILAGAAFVLRPFLFPETLVLGIVTSDDTTSHRILAVRTGVDLALSDRNGRAGKFRVKAELEPSSTDLSASAILVDAGAPWWMLDALGEGGPPLVSATSTRPNWNANAGVTLPHRRVLPSHTRISVAAADWLRRLGAKRVFLLEEIFDERSGVIGKAFREAANGPGLAFAGQVRFSEPFDSLPDEVVEAAPDAVFYAGTGVGKSREIIAALRKRGYRGEIVLADVEPGETFLDLSISEWEGCRLVSLVTPPPSAFLARHGAQRPGVWLGYQAATAALDALERAESKDPRALHRALASLGIFDANGDPLSPVLTGYTHRTGLWQSTESLK